MTGKQRYLGLGLSLRRFAKDHAVDPRHIPIRRFCRDARGATAAVTAIVSMSIVGSGALTIDSSTFYVAKRKLQSATDLAAAAAAADMAHASTAAATALAANGFPTAGVQVTTGVYTANSAVAANARFIAGSTPANAVSVVATASAPVIFGRMFTLAGAAQGSGGTGSVALSAKGMATVKPAAVFGIGSRLASLNGGIANAVLSGLTGSTISLNAIDYESMASANVDMGGFLRALAPSLGLQAGTYNDVLSTPITLNQALTALKTAGVDTRTAAAISTVLGGLTGGNTTFTLSKLFDLGKYDQTSIATIPPISLTMSAYEVLSGAIELASGSRQATVDLGAAVPGILSARLGLLVGSRPASAVVTGTSGPTTASTVQVRATLTVTASVAGLASVQLPLVLDLAKAVATTPGPTCAANSPTLTLAVTPSVADLWVGQVPLQASPATLTPTAAPIVTLLGIPVSALAHASISNVVPVNQTFAQSDVIAGTIKTTSTVDPVATLLTSLLGQLQLSVGGTGAPLPLLLAPLVSTLTLGLQGLATPTDSLLNSVTAALGVRIGQADTWVTGMTCGAPTLTQ